MVTGICLGGATTFQAAAAARDCTARQGTQPRHQSGHSRVPVQVTDAASGICGIPKCHADACAGVARAAVDGPTGLRLERQIFFAGKRDYYGINDSVPQEEQET